MKKYILFFIFGIVAKTSVCQDLPIALLRLQKSLENIANAMHTIKIQVPQQGPSKLKRLSSIAYEDFEKHTDVLLYTDEFMPLSKLLHTEVAGFYASGYIFVGGSGLFNGPKAENLATGFRERAVQEYKIHLMPKSADDVMLVLENLFKEATTNTRLRDAINDIKFRPGIDFSLSKEDMEKRLYKSGTQEIMPIIVIYVNGKDNAQYSLDTIYALFKNLPGLDIRPRYNEKITSLIYYAQSNGVSKARYSQEYVQPNMEVFVSDYIDPAHPVDYHLRNPAKHRR